jgi:hypothetical protein
MHEGFRLLSDDSSALHTSVLSALEIPERGCLVLLSTGSGGNVRESLCYVPDVRIDGNSGQPNRLVSRSTPKSVK